MDERIKNIQYRLSKYLGIDKKYIKNFCFNLWEIGPINDKDCDRMLKIEKFDHKLARFNIKFSRCQFEKNIFLNYTDDIFCKIKAAKKLSKPQLNLEFENCIFNGEIYVKEVKETNYEGIFFDCCTFEKFIYLGKSELNSLNIYKCEFKGEVRFISTNVKALFFDNLKFKNTVMLSDFESELFCIEHVVFGKNIDFYNSKIDNLTIERAKFNGEILFKYPKIGQIECSETKFKNFTLKYNHFSKKTNFTKSIFRKSIDLSHSTFESDADFSGCTFGTEVDIEKTIDLSSITFNGNVKFDESVFNHFVAFHTTSFKATGSFYKCKFYTIPNFSPADFKGILNINNVVWGEKNKGFGFKNIKELVEKAYSGNDIIENVKNLRSSFSGMKHKLIEQDNLLDAQNFHKAELYCKEIELEKKGGKVFAWMSVFYLFSSVFIACLIAFLFIKYSVDSVLSKILLIDLIICSFYVMCFAFMHIGVRIVKFANFDKKVDRVLLLLYRYTSEHHTNFSKIFHITLIVIVSYGGTLLVLDYIARELLVGFLLSVLIFLGAIFILCWLYNDVCELIAKVIVYFAMIFILFHQPFILNPVLGVSKSGEYENAKLNETMDALGYDRLATLASTVAQEAALNSQSPRELIIENKNAIKNNAELNTSFDDIKQAIKKDEVIYATRQSMSVIYLLLLVLCIFSLQKTARKNTIVPS